MTAGFRAFFAISLISAPGTYTTKIDKTSLHPMAEHRDPSIEQRVYQVYSHSKQYSASLGSDVSSLQVTGDGAAMVQHLDYRSWPDRGVPTDLASFNNLVRHVADERERDPTQVTYIHW